MILKKGTVFTFANNFFDFYRVVYNSPVCRAYACEYFLMGSYPQIISMEYADLDTARIPLNQKNWPTWLRIGSILKTLMPQNMESWVFTANPFFGGKVPFEAMMVNTPEYIAFAHSLVALESAMSREIYSATMKGDSGAS